MDVIVKDPSPPKYDSLIKLNLKTIKLNTVKLEIPSNSLPKLISLRISKFFN